MESSRALSRCFHQLSIQNQSCLRAQSTAATATLKVRSSRHPPRHTTQLPSSSRGFTTSQPTRQENTTQPDSPNVSETPPTQPDTQQGSQRSRSPQRMDLSSLVEDPDYKPPVRRPFVGRSAEAGRSEGGSATRAAIRDKLNAQIDDFLAGERGRAVKKPIRRGPSNYDTYGAGGTLFNQTRTPTRPARPPPSSQDIATSMKNMVNMSTSNVDMEMIEQQRERDRAREQLRLHPSLGKSVDVNEAAGFGVTRAFITLEARINGRGNAVRKDERAQMFHVRQGQLKKLKRRERWRVIFREGFIGECARVRKMIRQGW